MGTIAEIVREELAAAGERIKARIAALLGGAPREPARAPEERSRFRGRVKERLSPEDASDARRRVLAAVKAGAATAGEIQAATSLERHRVTYCVNALRAQGKIRRRGKGRTARYAAT